MVDRIRTHPRTLLLGGLVVAALGVLAWGIAQRTDPRDLVVAYTDAIAAGDVEAANALATDGVGDDARLPVAGSMEDAVLVTDLRVGQEGEPTSVSPLSGADYEALGYDVAFRVQGRQVSDEVYVEQTGGFFLWSEYRIRGSLAQPARLWLSYPLTGLDVAVGSSTVPIGPPADDAAAAAPIMTEIALYPGGYRVVPDPSAAVPLDPQDLPVAEGSAAVVVEATPDQLRAATGPQLVRSATDALAECLEDADDAVVCDGGAIGIVDDATGVQVSWRVDGDVAVVDDTVSQQTWRTAATVVATWTGYDGVAREQRFDLTGQVSVVSVTGDDVQVVASWTRGRAA